MYERTHTHTHIHTGLTAKPNLKTIHSLSCSLYIYIYIYIYIYTHTHTHTHTHTYTKQRPTSYSSQVSPPPALVVTTLITCLKFCLISEPDAELDQWYSCAAELQHTDVTISCLIWRRKYTSLRNYVPLSVLE
jgi:hypothetical protein